MEATTKQNAPLEMIREDIVATAKKFFEQSEMQVLGLKGAKKAGAASRKLSNQLGKLCKEWRKASNDAQRPADDQSDEE